MLGSIDTSDDTKSPPNGLVVRGGVEGQGIPTAIVYIMESSGGMVAGDRNDITIKLAPDSRARIVQQSAMKIYPSHTGETCFYKIDVDIAERARLEWMPEVIIPFIDAKFQVDTTLRRGG